jgi:hypothetical protein
MKHMNTFYEQNEEFYYIKEIGTFVRRLTELWFSDVSSEYLLLPRDYVIHRIHIDVEYFPRHYIILIYQYLLTSLKAINLASKEAAPSASRKCDGLHLTPSLTYFAYIFKLWTQDCCCLRLEHTLIVSKMQMPFKSVK